MSTLTLRLIRAAFAYLALGIALGAIFAVERSIGARLRPLHAELNLWGWVTLLIYGMAYHMLPRFSGRPLPRPRLAEVQSFLAIIGVALASPGWYGTASGVPLAELLLAGGGVLQAGAALLFAGQMAALLQS
jgi:cytochrome c oxidase cbb3-type subunit 1